MKFSLIALSLILFSVLPFTLFSASLPEISKITSLEVKRSTQEEQILINFHSEYEESISFFYEKGKLVTFLPATEFKKAISYKRINDKFVRDIRLRQGRKNVILEVFFADSSLNIEEMVKDELQGKKLVLRIFKNKADARLAFLNDKEISAKTPALTDLSTDLQTNKLFPESKQTDEVKGTFLFKDEEQKNKVVPEDSTTLNIVKMLFILFIILLFFYIILWCYNHFFIKKFNRSKGKYSIKLSSSFHINSKQKISIIEINDIPFACGISNNNISLISQVSNKSFNEFMVDYQKDNQKSVDFSLLRQEYQEFRRHQESKNTNPVDVEEKMNFASELINKVKSLKQID